MRDPSDLIGTRVLSIYTVRKVIGAGGMGTVYRAESDAEHPIAIKVLHPERAAPAMLERFRVEAQNMKAIRHPNVIQLLGLDTLADGRTFMAMEYLEGQTLADHLTAFGPLTTEDALPILLQVCAGLQAAHGRGIVHRDLKPENVFICDDGKVKLLDFGISKSLIDSGGAKLTNTGTVMGTIAYMAPEQAESTRTVSLVADLFSLGIIAYEMLTGARPYDTADDSIPTLLYRYIKVGTGDLPRPSLAAFVKANPRRDDITPEWIAAVDGAIDVRPQARIQTVRLFIEPVHQAAPYGPALVRALAPSLLECASALDRTVPAETGAGAPVVASSLHDARPTVDSPEPVANHPERARQMSTIAQSSGQVAPRPRSRAPLVAIAASAVAAVAIIAAIALSSGGDSHQAGAGPSDAAGPAPVAAEPAAPPAHAPGPAPPAVTADPPPASPANPPTTARNPGTDTHGAAATVAAPTSPGGGATPVPAPTPTKRRTRKPGGNTRPRDPDGLDL